MDQMTKGKVLKAFLKSRCHVSQVAVDTASSQWGETQRRPDAGLDVDVDQAMEKKIEPPQNRTPMCFTGRFPVETLLILSFSKRKLTTDHSWSVCTVIP